MGVTLLSPGIWTDSLSQTPIEYSTKVLQKYATNWEESFLNLDHSHTALARVCKVINPHFEDGSVKGDIQIYPITQNAKDIIQQIDNNLINWLSVEIRTTDVWNKTENMWSVLDMTYFGTAIVTVPASKGAKIIPEGIDVSDAYYE